MRRNKIVIPLMVMILSGNLFAQPIQPVLWFFNDLLDVPDVYTGSAGKLVIVNSTPDGLEFTDDPTLVGLTITGNSVFGLNSSVFQPTTDSTTFFQVLDAAGASVLNLDSTNRQTTVGYTSITYPFLINSTDASCQIKIYHTNSHAYMKWTDGNLRLQSDEGTNKNTTVVIEGKGTGYGTLTIKDEDGAESFNMQCIGGRARWDVTGTSPVALSLQAPADFPIRMFEYATEGETKPLEISGYGTGSGSKKTFAIEVEKDDVADTVYLDGLTNYLFGGNLITLNDTHEDTDGGGETYHSFKRQDGAETESTAARIEGSHDGSTANDTDGRLIFATNLEGTGLVNHVEIDSAGNTKIGDAGTTNYTHIDSGGRLLLEGTAQTWEDLRIVPGAFQFPGTADPTLEDWQPGGSGTIFKVYKFKKNDEVHFTCQLPHAYKEGSDIKPHLHWTPGDRGNEENGNTVGWKIDYSWANTDTAFGASATIDLSHACSGTDDLHELTSSGTITGTSKTISGILVIRLYRSDTNDDDTWVGATAALSPAILEFDLHYEVDSLGSDSELAK